MEAMKSLRELLILGPGPSSSHTIGPYRICRAFQKEHGTAFSSYEVTLFGSLSKTGKGHFTDRIVEEALGKDRTTVVFPRTRAIPIPTR